LDIPLAAVGAARNAGDVPNGGQSSGGDQAQQANV